MCPRNEENNITWCSILSTEDGGLTWHVQHRSLGRFGELQFLDPRNGFAIGGAADILATTDAGASWSPRYASAPHDLADIRFITPKVAVARASGTVFQLSEGANAWVFNYGNPDCSFSSISSSRTGDVWAGGRGTDGPCLYKTQDFGKTWTASFAGVASGSVAEAFGHSTIFGTQSSVTRQMDCASDAPTFLRDTEARLFVSCQMGSGVTLTTADAGRTWRFASEQGSCLAGCMTWKYQTGGGGPTFHLDSEHVWRRSAHDTIDWSTDGGLTWNPVQSPALCCDASSISFVDPEHGWVIVGGEIARTTDGGRTWARLPVTIE
jgi:photosystem II stability/assembly factor-like uncharacterized protein